MSDFHVTVVRINSIEKHPNADCLGITKIYDYPVIIRLGEFQEAELVAYLPIDAVVPDEPQWAFLEGHRRIKAKKLRGVYSQGMLAKLPNGPWKEGDDVQEILKITRYVPPPPSVKFGLCEAAPLGWSFPSYTDVESHRRFPNIIQDHEFVVITEKIHGANARFTHDGERLWVGSHHQIRKNDANIYWDIVNKLDLTTKLAKSPKKVVFGEIYGNVQSLRYGVQGYDFRVFDILDLHTGRYLDFELARDLAVNLDLPWVPVLYNGPWRKSLVDLAEGKSCVPGANHIKEGWVVRPVQERWDPTIGRVVLKRHSEEFLLKAK